MRRFAGLCPQYLLGLQSGAGLGTAGLSSAAWSRLAASKGPTTANKAATNTAYEEAEEEVEEVEEPVPKKARLAKAGEHRLAKWRAPSDEGNLSVAKEYNGGLRFLDATRDFFKDMSWPLATIASYFALPMVGLCGWEHLAATVVTLGALNRITLVHGLPNKVTKDLKGKSALIVGTSAMAIEVASQLCQMGATVRVAGPADLREVTSKALADAAPTGEGAGSMEYVELDLTDPHSIRAVASQFKAHVNKLDLMINCMFTPFPYVEFTKSGLDEMTLATNFLGPYHFTERLMPLLHSSKGRLINTSTRNHQAIIKQEIMRELINIKPVEEDYQSYKYFAAAHLGMLYYTKAVAKAKDGVPTAAVNIGTVAVGELTPKKESVGLFSYLMAKNAKEASQSVINAALRDDLVSGGYYSDCKLRRHGRSRIAHDNALLKEVLDWAAARTTKKF